MCGKYENVCGFSLHEVSNNTFFKKTLKITDLFFAPFNSIALLPPYQQFII